MILSKDDLELILISKSLGLVGIILVAIIVVFFVRLALGVVFKDEFEFIHNEIKQGNTAVAIYAGVIIGCIALGLIYAISNFLL